MTEKKRRKEGGGGDANSNELGSLQCQKNAIFFPMTFTVMDSNCYYVLVVVQQPNHHHHHPLKEVNSLFPMPHHVSACPTNAQHHENFGCTEKTER